MNDRELAPIGALAMKEYEAWIARNKARSELRAFLRAYQDETGEWFDRGEAEPDDVTKFDALRAPAKAAQSALATARAATRRGAKKAMHNAKSEGAEPLLAKLPLD